VLAESAPLCEVYDVALLDLDGVVYLGSDPIAGAAPALAHARRRGMRLAFVTNNASRRPAEVARLLAGMGIPAAEADVVTSAQAAVARLGERVPAGSRVLVVGASAFAEEVRAAGFQPVTDADSRPAAVVQGMGPATTWQDLAEATVAVRAGAVWIAANADNTLPSARGDLPGNGALVAVVAATTGKTPEVVGKPQPALHELSVQRTGARRPLVVGDRLDTDIEGAVAGGADSLLVLTGVTTPDMLLAAPAGRRPTYLAADLAGLIQPQPAVRVDGDWRACGGFRVRAAPGRLVLDGGPGAPVDALRALCAAGWAWLAGPVEVLAQGEEALAALKHLGLPVASTAS